MKYREFLLRRLHSLSGMVPMGAFLFMHFFTNSFSHGGEAAFNEKVHFLRSLPYLNFIEWGALFFPFLFHMFYGLVIIYSGQPNVLHESHGRNWLYFLQRLSAFPALGFILFHVVSTRFMHSEESANMYVVMTEAFSNPLILAFYILGIVSIAFHFANGIATFCMTWGLTVGPTSQRIVGYACAGVGFVLAVMGIWAAFGFTEAGKASASQAIEHAPKVTGWAIESARGLLG